MTTNSAPRIKITYATLSADNEELHAGFEAAVTTAKTQLGWHYKNYIDGEWRDGAEKFEARSPIDRDLLFGTFATAYHGGRRRRGRRSARRPAGVGRGALA